MTAVDDGRNPAWPVGSVPLDLWEAVLDHRDLSGPEVGRLRLALDTLADAADLLDLAKSIESSRDIIAAYAGIRAARKAASDLVAELTTERPKTSAKAQHHGHRPQRG